MPKEKTPVLNAAGTHIWLNHPVTGGVWEAPKDVAATFVQHAGWEYADAPGEDLSDVFAASTAEGEAQTGFDPNEHTVADINDYLKSNQHAPGEIDRVLALEAAGQDRSSVKDPRKPNDPA